MLHMLCLCCEVKHYCAVLRRAINVSIVLRLCRACALCELDVDFGRLGWAGLR
jgi:hypothetical protein